jgi:hypothetical protein
LEELRSKRAQAGLGKAKPKDNSDTSEKSASDNDNDTARQPAHTEEEGTDAAPAKKRRVIESDDEEA